MSAFIGAFLIFIGGLVIGLVLKAQPIQANYLARWYFCSSELPPNRGSVISNYPVAFFDAEFGIIVDQAEYHPNSAPHWRMVHDGEPCQPYAWYDIPFPLHPRGPQDMVSPKSFSTYI